MGSLNQCCKCLGLAQGLPALQKLRVKDQGSSTDTDDTRTLQRYSCVSLIKTLAYNAASETFKGVIQVRFHDVYLFFGLFIWYV